MSKVLVTGGAGFIGRYTCLALVALGHDVKIYDNFSNASREGLTGLGQVIDADVRDRAALKDVLVTVDHIVHLAALVSVPISIEMPRQVFDINVAATEQLLDICREIRFPGRVIYASSASVYANELTGNFKEEWATGQGLLSPYASSKFMNEVQAGIYNTCYDLKTTAFRFFNVYGAGQDPKSPYSGVITRLLDARDEGKKFTIFGDGSITRDYIAVEDIAGAIALLIGSNDIAPRVMNLGTGHATTLNELVQFWQDATGKILDYSYGPSRSGDQQHSCADNSLVREILPEWRPVSLSEGLARWVGS
ncbi:NAD-dependent epimerase/dehydratase family protein [Thalassospira sp.]|uniref:NAD-dependent epimerase/dehydratase family protein n=1 Tax=Thalassospira sp. TaxID=1912094 RepID=UPI003AA8503F